MDERLHQYGPEVHAEIASVIGGLEYVYGPKMETNLGEYLKKRINSHKKALQIDTIIAIGAPGSSKTTLLSEMSHILGGKLIAVFFDKAYHSTVNQLGPRDKLHEADLLNFWQITNDIIVDDYRLVSEATKRKEFKNFTKGLELVCIGSPEHDRGLSALKRIMPTRNHTSKFFVVAIAPDEAREGHMSTQTQATYIRDLVDKSRSPEEVVDNLLVAGVLIKNDNLRLSKTERGLKIKSVVGRMATREQVIALNKEIVDSVNSLSNNDLKFIRSFIPEEKFHNSPHILHLMYLLKVKIRIPEGNYALVFNPYNQNLRPQIDLGFNSLS